MKAIVHLAARFSFQPFRYAELIGEEAPQPYRYPGLFRFQIYGVKVISNLLCYLTLIELRINFSDHYYIFENHFSPDFYKGGVDELHQSSGFVL